MRELFVNSYWTCRDNGGGCVPVRARQRLSRNSTNSSRPTHVEFTSSSYIVHDRVANFCTTHTVTCISRIAGASGSRLVYALLEQFAHCTTSSQVICDEFTCSSRLLRNSGARVGAGAYIGVLDTAPHFTACNIGTFRPFSHLLSLSKDVKLVFTPFPPGIVCNIMLDRKFWGMKQFHCSRTDSIRQGLIQADAIDANASVRKKMADACIGQICTTNNYKHHSLRSALIKCVYAITHLLEFVRWYFNHYNKLRSLNLFVNSCLKENWPRQIKTYDHSLHSCSKRLACTWLLKLWHVSVSST